MEKKPIPSGSILATVEERIYIYRICSYDPSGTSVNVILPLEI
jgi:hypothetical protein